MKWLIKYFLLGCTLFALTYFALFTTYGLRQILVITQHFLPGTFTMQSVNGYLLGPWHIKKLHYSSDTLTINAQEIHMQWSPAHILNAQLTIQKLKLKDIVIKFTPHNTSVTSQKKSQQTFHNFDMNFIQQYLKQFKRLQKHLHIKELIIEQLHFQSPQLDTIIKGTITHQWQLQVKSRYLLKTSDTASPVPLNITHDIVGAKYLPYVAQEICIATSDSQIKSANCISGTLKLNASKQLIIDIPNIDMKQLHRLHSKIPLLTGTAQLHGVVKLKQKNLQGSTVSIYIPSVHNHLLGLEYQDMAAKLVLQANKFLLNAELKSFSLNAPKTTQQGKVVVNGEASFSNVSPNISLNLQADHFTVLNSPSYKLIVTPNINLKYVSNLIKISGNILVNQARIQPPSLHSVVTLPSDVEFTDQPQKPAATPGAPLNIESQLDLQLGNDTELNLLGLTGKLTGNIQLLTKPQQPTLATGQLHITEGHYQAYGQQLTIKQGDLNYQNNAVDDPGLNIKAQRQFTRIKQSIDANNIQNIIVGIHATGTLQQPRINLYSVPAGLSEVDMLSYLLTGSSVENASLLNLQIINQALSIVNPQSTQSTNIVEKIQQKTHLDQLSVVQVDAATNTNNNVNQNFAIMLGKALSPRLYVNYTVGILDPFNILQIRYAITKRLSLETAVSEKRNSIDVVYSFEK
ncbi:MAG: hypothetical protein Tsb005_08310 [Gammaproteobacteria bacterium]